jgi:putative hydrolase
MGRKRVEAIRDSLAGRFRRRPAGPVTRPKVPVTDLPSVAELLNVDEEYRRLAELDRLPRIAPRRFNPEGKAWLPILHTQRDARHYTALYSNTARAHELGTTRDWVVIYRDDAGDHGQWSVITAGLGKLKGKRVVRGRENECAMHYGA